MFEFWGNSNGRNINFQLEEMPMYKQLEPYLITFGQAVKEARESRNLTREQLAEMLDLSARHVQYIETGQRPSLEKFYKSVTPLNISVDRLFFPENNESKTTQRRHIDAVLDSMDENDLSIVAATVTAMQKAKNAGDK
jgi:transcriptional regulator with XRE-family HTH domain